MKLTERDCRFIFYRIAQALHKFHVQGLAHRDIKPENILLTPAYKIRFVDFDCVSPLAGRDGCSQFLMTRIGTQTYMAPEILKGVPYRGTDVDIFSFGVMLITLCPMRYPFDSASASDPK